MFEANTTLRLNIVMLVITAGFFAVVLLAPGPESTTSADSTGTAPASPTPTQPILQSIEPPITLITGPSATPSATPTRAPTATPTARPSETPTPTETVETPTATSTLVSGIQHTVAPGEVLSAIAAQYGVTVGAIVAANGLEDPNRLEVGQVLLIPQPATPTP